MSIFIITSKQVDTLINTSFFINKLDNAVPSTSFQRYASTEEDRMTDLLIN